MASLSRRKSVPDNVNGDGSDDVVLARAFPECYYPVCRPPAILIRPGPWQIDTVLSPDTRRDAFNWRPAEVTGDGREDLVYVEHLNPGIRVHTVPRAADGSLARDTSGQVAPVTDTLYPKDPDLPGLDNPDTSRWLPVDVNADGRSDLVYVDYSEELRCNPTAHGIYPKPGSPLGGGQVQIPINLCEKNREESGLRVYTLLSDGKGSWEPRYYFWKGFNFEDIRQWKPADVNGDGMVDLVHPYFYDVEGPGGERRRGSRIHILFSKGDGTWLPQTPPPWPSIRLRNTANWRPMDVNGDGKADLVNIHSVPPESSSPSCTYVDTLLSNFAYDKQKGLGDWPDDEYFPGDWLFRQGQCLKLNIPHTLNWKSADVNGDGKTDLVHMDRGTDAYVLDTLLSTGSGKWWELVTSKAGNGAMRDTPSWKTADINGDGRTDLVHVSVSSGHFDDYEENFIQDYVVHTLTSTGEGGWRQPETYLEPTGLPYDPFDWGNSTLSWQSTGFDGNGMDDLVRVDYRESDTSENPRLDFESLSSDAPLDLTTDFSNSVGGKTTVGYAPSSRWLPLNPPRAGCHLPTGLVLNHVSSVTTDELTSDISDTVTYEHRCPRWSYRERSFLGYELVESTHPESLNSPKRLSLARYKISDTCGARIGVSEVQAADDSILSRTETYYRGDPGWDYHDPGPPPYRCLQESSVEYQCEKGWQEVQESTCAAKRTEFSHEDEFGNLTEMDECSYEGFDHSYDTVGPECENTSPNEPGRTTLIEYKPATGPYIVGLPSREAVFERRGDEDVGNEPVSDTRYCYDQDTSQSCEASPSKGLLTATREWDDQSGRYLTTSYGYDDYGNQTSVEDANKICCTTTVFDQTYHIFPEKICNAKDHCTEQEWDPVIQQPKRITDANQMSTRYDYDAFGRLIYNSSPNGGERHLYYNDCCTDRRVREWVEDGTQDGLWTVTYLDGLGRIKRVVKEGDALGVPFRQDTSYGDSSSRVYRQSHWYKWTKEDPVYEENHYDELGRLTRQGHPDESALRWEYGEDGTRTSVTSLDELSNEKTTYIDALGRTEQVREVNRDDPEDPNYDTFYEYDSLDNLTRVTDDKGNVTTMTWDSLGRQISIDDPDMGRWTYDYDSVGNLLLQTDARDVMTQFTYDELNRFKTKQWNPPHGSVTKWNYDEEEGHGKAPVGRLTSVSDPTGESCANGLSERLSYDEMGQVSSETKCVLGREYTTSTGYDLLGRQSWVEYPDGEKVNYDYDSAGRLQSMGSTLQSYVDSLGFDAAGNLTYAKLPNGLEENLHYDVDREWLTETSVQPADDTPHQQRCDGETPPQAQGELYQACYKYKPNGLIQSTSSTTNKMNLSFMYDDLDRLTDVTRDTEQQFDYDSIGNMTNNSALGDYEYRPSGSDGCGAEGTSAGPHAVCQAGPREYLYDANGNMTLRDGLEMRWNEGNLPEWIQYQTNKWEHYLYDASGERVFKESAGNPAKGMQKQEIQQARSHENQSNVSDSKRIVVSPGDSLWLISSRWLGPNATLQQIDTAVAQIYALNRGQIGPNPDLIFPGQKFLVPPTWGPERVEHQEGKLEQRHNDATGERVLKEPTGDLAKNKRIQERGTYYFGPLLSYSSSGSNKGLTKYYYAGPMLIAQNTSDGTHWFHSDHLGSIRLVTNQDGEVDQRYDYEPFGLGSSQLAGQKFENDIGFTGHRADANTGLSYMGARYYDSQLARFISPDSIVPDPTNSQALNRYSYVYNNPLSYTDPSGHEPVDAGASGFLENVWTQAVEAKGVYEGQPAHLITFIADDEGTTTTPETTATLTSDADNITLGEISQLSERQAAEFFEENPAPGVTSIKRDAILLNRDNIDFRDSRSASYTMLQTILDNGGFYGGRMAISGESAGVMKSAGARAAAEIGLAGERGFIGNGIIDMRGAPAGSIKNALGYPVNRKYFWKQMLEKHSEYLSPKNQALIKRGWSPEVDKQWLKYHPEQELYEGDILVHHHIEQGPYAVGIPKSFHQDPDFSDLLHWLR